MMLSCKEATHLVSQGLDRRLGLAERVALRLHLAICDGCSNFKKQVAFLRKAMRRLAESD
ncbi:MAG TPA: zf-HC2 domain-containing protein [Burkholderiales bacterium]|jgi:predicted anti-sigma-YlaC factor YlaD|nr:zf-HC2 domain-containing protein [Burkholderiales bacterium]